MMGGANFHTGWDRTVGVARNSPRCRLRRVEIKRARRVSLRRSSVRRHCRRHPGSVLTASGMRRSIGQRGPSGLCRLPGAFRPPSPAFAACVKASTTLSIERPSCTRKRETPRRLRRPLAGQNSAARRLGTRHDLHLLLSQIRHHRRSWRATGDCCPGAIHPGAMARPSSMVASFMCWPARAARCLANRGGAGEGELCGDDGPPTTEVRGSEYSRDLRPFSGTPRKNPKRLTTPSRHAGINEGAQPVRPARPGSPRRLDDDTAAACGQSRQISLRPILRPELMGKFHGVKAATGADRQLDRHLHHARHPAGNDLAIGAPRLFGEPVDATSARPASVSILASGQRFAPLPLARS